MNAKDLFEILVRENADMLIAYVRAAVRDDAAADDVFQETMLTAWRRLDDYDKQRPFGPWLRGIAAKLILAHFRRSSRAAAACDETMLEYLSTRFEQVQRLRGDTLDEKLDALRDCLDRLPEKYREPVRLRYAESMRPASIAQRLKLAGETVKKRLQRAKARLLDCLEHKLRTSETSP